MDHSKRSGNSIEAPECEGDIEPDFIAIGFVISVDDVVPKTNEDNYTE